LVSENNPEDIKKLEYLKNLNLFDRKYCREGDIKIISKTWERPINAKSKNPSRDYGNQFTVGFIDFAVTYFKPTYPYLNGIKREPIGEYGNRQRILGIEDEIQIKFGGEEKTIFVEVKTEINSLGELIRQINLYKDHLPGDYFVLCPDNTYKQKLMEQKIYFIEYTGGNIKKRI